MANFNLTERASTNTLAVTPSFVDHDLAEDLRLLRDAVRGGGSVALDFYRQPVEVNIKSDGTQVSEADLAVNALLLDRLMGGRPDYGWMSEESPDDLVRLGKRRTWIIDPIDGTRSFLMHSSEWTIAAGLVEHGRPVLAVVYNPVDDLMYEATAGGGAFLNGERIAVSGREALEGSLLLASASLLRKKIWTDPWPSVETLWVSSVAYRLALVASGNADATLSLTHKSDWDLAAADLIVREAAGRVTDHLGRDLIYNRESTRQLSLVAATPAIHADIVARTRAAMPEEARPA